MKQFFSACLLAMASSLAWGGFVGVDYETVGESEFGTTYRVYATFDNPTDELVAVYALETAPMVVGVSTSFYQDAFGGALAQNVNPLLFGAFPSLAYDSWFAIGSEDANGTSDAQQVGMDTYFTAFEAGGGFTIDTFIGGSWFLIPGQSADAVAGADNRVLVGQFTTDGVVNMTLNFQWDDASSNTSNAEGLSLVFPEVPVPGCTSESADNYNPAANEDDGSCIFAGLCTGLSYELVAADPLGTGEDTYRIYANFSSNDVEVTAVYGTDTEPWTLVGEEAFYQDAFGSDFGGSVNPLLFGAFPSLAFDTWWTIGAEPGDDDGLNSAFDAALTSFDDWNGGGDFVVNTFVGGSIFVVPGANAQGVPVDGKVLLGQVTTAGTTEALVNVQFRDANQESFYASGMPLVFPVAGAGCNDEMACNYNPLDEGDGDCIFPAEFYDCDGCLNDSDGDGVCDELEVLGCTDSAACNFDLAATEEDGSCTTLDECGVCGGSGIAPGTCDCEGNVIDDCGECGGDNSACVDCEGVPNGTAVLDECGVCGGDGTTCLGCTNPAADNYDADALADDGSCTFGNGLCTGLSYDLVASDPLGTGASTYRIYANFTSSDVEVTAIYGTDSEPWSLIGNAPFYQDAFGSDFGGSVNPLLFGAFPTLEFDTWWTIGAEPGDDDGLNSAFDAALTSFDDWNNGGDFVVNTFIGGSIFIVPGANGQGNPINGRVLLGQVTTVGVTDAVVNIQFRDANQESVYASGMTLTFPVAGAGCNNELACNYNPEAEGDADCVFPDTYYDCDGCINDADGDGVCDELEVLGCTDDLACNFDINATENDGSCLSLDLCGVCGGDNSTCSGCTDSSAANYDAEAIVDDGSCLYAGCTNPDADNYDPSADLDDGSCIISGCTNPDADNYDPAANNDDGSCIVSGCTNPAADNYNPDANNDDGSCIVSGCTDASADNYNPDANNDDGSCLFSGCTNPAADNYDPVANVDDGSCIISGCTNPSADNYDPAANNDDGSCIVSGCTNPLADNYDPAANNDDGSCVGAGCTYPGADNYDAVYTVDDGSCVFSGCTDASAENYVAFANNDDGSCIFEPCTGESACPFDSNGDGEIGSADLLDFLVAYGAACSDL